MFWQIGDMKCLSAYSLVVASGLQLMVSNAVPINLGSGEPGLHIVYNTTNDNPRFQYQYVIFLDEPWTVGDGLIGGFDKRNIQIVADRNFGLKEKLRSHTWWQGDVLELYAFDEQTAFTCEGNSKPPDAQIYTKNHMGYYTSAVGFSTLSKSTGWFPYSPNTFEFIEVSFKNGKQAGGTN